MSRRRKAWDLLKMLGDGVTLEHVEPCSGGMERNTIYNPYKKKYVKRGPTEKRTKEIELQMCLDNSEYPEDELWIGDRMEDIKEEGVLRIWHQNWNGMEKYDEEIMKYQLSLLIDNQINYFTIVESRINRNYKKSMEKWERAKESIVPNGEMKFTSTPGFPTYTASQPGGVVSGYQGSLRGRYRTQSSDPLGRWHYHQFQGQQRDLRIYSLYRVNYGRKETQGETTAWTQQHNILTERNDNRNPRAAVIDDFIKEIEEAVKNKYSIIIMSDLNEDIDSGEGTNKKFEDLGLNNVMKEYLGAKALPRTCKKGPRTIDHIWVTGNVLQALHSAGYAPFGFIKDSDHRGLFMDFHYKDILDSDINKLEPHHRKRLQSSIPARTEQYMKKINESWAYHKIEERFHQIREDLEENGRTRENEALLNTLDTQITEIMIYAEKHCSNVPSNTTYQWSVKMKEAVTKFIRSTTERTKARKIKIGVAISEAISNFKKKDMEWKDAKKEYEEAQKTNKQDRKTHLDECAVKNAERKGTTVQNEIKQLKHVEFQREQAMRMKTVMKPFGRNGVTTVLIPAVIEYTREQREQPNFDHHNINTMWARILPHNGNDVIHWERITDKTTVEKLLLQWQRKHFTQANETPLASVEWNDELRNESVQEEILAGEYVLDETLPETIKDIFSQMRRPQCVQDEITFESTYEEFRSFIKGASEKTSTSPSGRGYNHYKTLLIEEGGEDILKLLHAIVELARKYGIILNRWQKTVTTLMEKKQGVPKIHRMRALHIIEAEVQFLAKLFYCKKLLFNAEKFDLITNQQYGGRNEKQTQMAVINKLLYYNICHQQVMEAAFVDDDARNCYDRIITALSAVEMRSWGHSFEEAEFSVNFLQSQQYHVRTQLGITKDSYTYSRQEQTHGSGQGIAWAGVKFTRTSDTICRAMSEKCAGMHFYNPTKTIEVKRNGDIFVDDTALGTTANTCGELGVLQQLQKDQQYHAFLLYATGHKLALDKCHFYWVSFERDGVRHRHKLNEESPGTLGIKAGYDEDNQLLARYQPFQTHKTLGCHISVTNNQKGQLRKIGEKIDNWCQKMRTRYLNDEDSRYAYHGYLRAAIQYIIGTTSFTKKQCEQLSKKFETILLHSHNLNRNCSRTMLYMPKRYGGLGIKNIFHMQGQEKLKFFGMHIRRNDVTGKLIQICMDWSQMEAGTRLPFYSAVYSSIRSNLTPTWITHIIDYLSACKAEMILPTFKQDDLVRDNDFYLMDVVRTLPISEENKQIFNQIRLYLKIETAADIVSLTNGSLISSEIYNAKNSRQSTKAWPQIQPYPNKWNEIWRSILRSYISPKLQTRPLGIWRNSSHQMWKWKTNENQTFLFNETSYFLLNGTTGIYELSHETCLCEIPCEVYENNSQLYIEAIQRIVPKPQQEMATESWILRNWGTLEINIDIENNIVEHLKNNNIVGAADGSELDGKMAHSFCLATQDTCEILCTGSAPVDFPVTMATSYRAEAFGALAIVTLLEKIQKRHNIQNVSVPVYIDNMEAIKTMQGNLFHSMSNILSDNQDVYIELNTRVRQSKIKIIAEHVKGHMNEVSDELTDSQALNQLMDTKVGHFIRNIPPRLTPTSIPPVLRQQKFLICCNSVPCSSSISDTLISGEMSEAIVKYYRTHHHMEEWEMEAVDFPALRQVMEKNSKKLVPRVKSINHQWNTMEVCKRWKTSLTDICPLCGNGVESWHHVYQCKCVDITRVHNNSVSTIIAKMDQLQTLPQLQNTLVHIMKAWRNGEEPTFIDEPNNPYNENVKYAFEIQREIGFSAMFNGLFVREWGEVQNDYYRKEIRDKKLNISRWKQNILGLFLQLGIDLWNERCTILHNEKKSTEEARYRNSLLTLLIHLQENKQYLHQSDAYLLSKKRSFFTSCARANLEMWHMRLNAAVERQQRRKQWSTQDIRKFGNLRKSEKKRERPRVRKKKKTYTQQTLFSHQYTRVLPLPTQPNVSNTATTTNTNSMKTAEIVSRKRKLETMILRRRSRPRKIQSTLDTKNIRQKRTRPAQAVETQRTIPRLISSLRQYVEPLRKRLRKSGSDPKNKR